jgi:hypothetical protein
MPHDARRAVGAEEFLAVASAHLGTDVRTLPMATEEPAVEAQRVVIEDPYRLTADEIDALATGFHSRFGVVAFECRAHDVRDDTHPLIHIGAQLRDRMSCRWPVVNWEDVADGTTKIFDVGPEEGKPRALSNQALAAHQDGWLSLPGVLAVTGLCADSAPSVAAVTYMQNVVRLALDLWRIDEPAFARLFDADAVAVVRRSDGERWTFAVLGVSDGRPRAFFRAPNDEFDVLPGRPDPDLTRAMEFLIKHTGPDAPGSTYTRLDRPGRGFLLDNYQCVHGRTAFFDGNGQKRVIASKWWASDDQYKDIRWGAPEAMAGR